MYDPWETIAHSSERERRIALARYLRTPVGGGEMGSSSRFWRGRRVVITGSAEFLGAAMLEHLRELDCRHIDVPQRDGLDLTSQADVERLYRDSRPDIVLHLAEQAGGIGANRTDPGEFFYTNLIMGMLMIEGARRAGVGKFVQMGTITSYPRFTSVPFREEDLWNGYPDPTNAPYGIAKKALLVQLQAYREQYGFNGIYLIPANLYGARDNFDPTRSYVIPSLIRKMVEAEATGADEVVVWGTGAATREFLYVDDCVRATLLAAEHYEGAEPVNLGSGSQVRISELATQIAELAGFRGRIVYDRAQPDGQPRRAMDVTRAQQLFGFRAHVPLRQGLEETISWYRAHLADTAHATSAPAR